MVFGGAIVATAVSSHSIATTVPAEPIFGGAGPAAATAAGPAAPGGAFAPLWAAARAGSLAEVSVCPADATVGYRTGSGSTSVFQVPPELATVARVRAALRDFGLHADLVGERCPA